jgi:hypothetical protein
MGSLGRVLQRCCGAPCGLILSGPRHAHASSAMGAFLLARTQQGPLHLCQELGAWS